MIRRYIQAQPKERTAKSQTGAARKFLQERLAGLSLLLCAGSAAFWFPRVAIEAFSTNPLSDLFDAPTVMHLLGLSSVVALWLYTRAGERSSTALRIAETAAMTASSISYVSMMAGMDMWDRPVLLIILINTVTLFARSIWVPSTARRTALLGATMGFFIVGGCTYFSYRNFDAAIYAAGTEPALQTRADVALDGFQDAFGWWSLVVFICAIASNIIHGLRREVRDFRELGQYTLEAKLGQGGMGTVYRARHGMLRRPTAIKLLRAERSGELDLARFEREVQLTAQLSHPNIVTVFDYGRTPDGTFYYAMEYLDGASLADVVARTGPLPPARVARILRDVAGALAEAHASGLIHRDIKPANIMLCKYGGTMGVAKVVDFGLVRPVEAGIAHRNVLAEDAHTLAGTPGYMAPEAFLQPNEVDPRSDLYALGAVAYYMLTGTPVFDGKTMMQIENQHIHETPEPLSRRLGKPLPPALEELVLVCLEKLPDRRPQSARELRDRLDAIGDLGPWDEEAWWAEAGQSLLLRHAGGAVPDGHASTLVAATPPAAQASASAPTIAIDLRHRG